ncbi:hypothetical protein AAP_04018 [Ascosphaera apis ARSEF 7405]|uniref:CipC-like antibiotic response protein n=1 Tax=Ascosphaera apis ARSEF 7405 TaxID=392613 RepID=A0A167XGR1_9EURO|nr:hypothetical protein AAP_04018 [Ascosphaera apis ARSEF 7405]
MFGWHDSEKAHEEVYNGDEMEHHHAKFSHNVIAGAASYQAMKAYSDHKAKHGTPDNHATAKNVIAGIVGAEVDRLAEGKGRDAWDRHRIKKQAEDNAKSMYDEKYGGN